MERTPRSNQFPFESHHLNQIGQTLGAEIVSRIEYMQRTYAKDGGCSPNAVKLVFPDGHDGFIDEESLLMVLDNFDAWHELN